MCFKQAATPAFTERQGAGHERAGARGRTDGWGLQLVSGGTDNHLMLIDLNDKGITGKEADATLDPVGIIVNKNAVPGDRRSPTVTSGLRLGTPAMTTRGFGAEESREVGRVIAEVLTREATDEHIARLRARTQELLDAHPLYRGMDGSTARRPATTPPASRRAPTIPDSRRKA